MGEILREVVHERAHLGKRIAGCHRSLSFWMSEQVISQLSIIFDDNVQRFLNSPSGQIRIIIENAPHTLSVTADLLMWDNERSSSIRSLIGGAGSLELPDEAVLQGFDISFLDLIVLYLLDHAPMSGYAMKKKLTTQFHLRTSYGTLYPRLKLFEKKGVVRIVSTMEMSSPRSSGIIYELTPLGKKLLSNGLVTFDGFLQKIRPVQDLPSVG